MGTVTSESPDGKGRIVIDPASETVTFIGCYKPSPTTFFTLHVRSEDEYVCPFTDILGVYESNMTQPGHGPIRRMVLEVITAHGKVSITQSWSTYAKVKDMMSSISEATPDPHWQRNSKTLTWLMLLSGFIITLIVIGLTVWFGVI